MAVKQQVYSVASGDIIPISYNLQRTGDNAVTLDALNRYFTNNNILRPTYRIYVLHEDDSLNYEIPLSDILTDGSYNENYQNGSRRSLSFTLFNEDGRYTPDIDKLTPNTRIRLDVGIICDTGVIFWRQQGVFIITDITPSHQPNGSLVSVRCSDKFILFEGTQGVLESTYEIPIGSDIESVLIDILRKDSGDGFPLDSQPLIYHSSFKGRKTAVEITHQVGDQLSSIISDLATQLPAEYFYNASGQLTLVPFDEIMGDQNKPLLGSCVAENGDISQLSFTLNYSEAINRVIVIGASNVSEICEATAVNNDASSPLCYQRIGMRTAPIINDSNIASKLLAEERAQYELRKHLILSTSTSTDVVLNPIWTVNNLVALYDDFFGLVGQRFLIKSISFTLNYSGLMTIGLTNIQNLSFLT